MFKLLAKSFILCFISLIIASCASNKGPISDSAANSSNIESNEAAKNDVIVPNEINTQDNQQINSSQSLINHNAVYFAFDKYDIKDFYTGIISANGSYLAKTQNTDNQATVLVSGNTDSLGSVEYNLALAQKRADAVKNALIASGANASQIEAISYGKLKPKYSNDSDANRALNRRVDISYKNNSPTGYSVDKDELPFVEKSFYDGTVEQGVE